MCVDERQAGYHRLWFDRKNPPERLPSWIGAFLPQPPLCEATVIIMLDSPS